LFTTRRTSRLAALVFVASWSSNSASFIKSVYDSHDCLHTSLIFLIRGSLIDDLSPKMKLIILALNGPPFGSIEFNLQISTASLSAHWRTFVFLWRHHEQANYVNYS